MQGGPAASRQERVEGQKTESRHDAWAELAAAGAGAAVAAGELVPDEFVRRQGCGVRMCMPKMMEVAVVVRHAGDGAESPAEPAGPQAGVAPQEAPQARCRVAHLASAGALRMRNGTS